MNTNGNDSDEMKQPIRGEGLAASAKAGENVSTQENHHDIDTTATTRSALEPVAGEALRRGECAGSVSPAGVNVHAEFNGVGKRASQSTTVVAAIESTRPLDATRELATSAGALTYTEVSERLAVSIVHCLDAVLEKSPDEICITPEWIREIHFRIASELFPDWAGRFRATDVQVGTHLPPPGHEVAVYLKNFCLDLDERLRHLQDAASIAALMAWVDWRFQWIHPFRDFNGRTGRILLVALSYKLGLPPVDPAASESGKVVYFGALRAADAGDISPLTEIWLGRLERGD